MTGQDLGDKLTTLANEIADELIGNQDIHVETKIAGLQRVAQFFAMMRRMEPDEPTASSFGSYKHDIASANGQRAPGPGKPGNGDARPYAIHLADSER